jgi:histidine triad (HIT) family protein
MTTKTSLKNDCAFCQIIKGTRKAYIVHEDSEVVCVLSRHPRTNGQCFVMPKQHHSCLDDISDKELQALFTKARTIANDLQKKLKARGVDLLYTCGESEYPSVNHVAVHLFPRYAKDNLNVWPKLDTSEEAETSE